LLFGFPVPLEFKNCRGQIIGGVGDVEFGSAKVMMLEVGLKDCAVGVGSDSWDLILPSISVGVELKYVYTCFRKAAALSRPRNGPYAARRMVTISSTPLHR